MTNTNPTVKPFNFETPNWSLLETAIAAAGLPKDTISEFMWMGEWREGQHQYKHCHSRMYAVLSLGMSRTEMAAMVKSARIQGWNYVGGAK